MANSTFRMSAEGSKRRRRRRRRFFPFRIPQTLRYTNARGPIVLYGAALFLWMLVVLSGGGIPLISKAIALVGTGVLLLWKPPRRLPPRLILIGGAGFLVYGILTLVVPRPGGAGAVFESLVDLGVTLPGTLSIQPMATLEVLLISLAGIGFFAFLLDQPLNHHDRRQVLKLAIWLLSFLALGIVLGNAMGAIWVFAPEAGFFTFIANKNQMANLMMLGAFLCLASSWESIRRQGNWALFGVILSVILCFALFDLRSRSSLFLLLLGLMLWALLKGARSQIGPYLKVGIPVTLLLFSLFLFFGEETRDRILGQSGRSGFQDFRFAIYGDAIAMFLQRPLTGFGLGNFEAVFPQFRDHSFRAEQILHPESDFFWILTEGGLLGTALVGLILVGGLKVCLPRGIRRADPFRLVIFVGVLLFLLHGLVDVGGHRLGTLFFAIFLVALNQETTQRKAEGGRRPDPGVKPFWKGTGVVLIAGGVLWAVGTAFPLTTHRDHFPYHLKQAMSGAREAAPTEVYAALANRMVNWYPLDWNGYFSRAAGDLVTDREPDEALRDFRIARALNPSSARMTFQEGVYWLPVEPRWALDAWRETLNRPRDTQVGHRDLLEGYFLSYPQLREGLLELSESDAALRFQLLGQLRGETYSRALERDLNYDPLLRFYGEDQRTVLLRKWARSGGGERLLELLERHPDIIGESWQLKAAGEANTGNLRSAIRTVRREVQPPTIPVQDDASDIVHLEREFRNRPQDLLKGATLLRKQIELKRWAQALQTAVTLSRNPEAPDYVFFWAGEIYFMQDDLERSWNYFEDFLERRESSGR